MCVFKCKSLISWFLIFRIPFSWTITIRVLKCQLSHRRFRSEQLFSSHLIFLKGAKILTITISTANNYFLRTLFVNLSLKLLMITNYMHGWFPSSNAKLHFATLATFSYSFNWLFVIKLGAFIGDNNTTFLF